MKDMTDKQRAAARRAMAGFPALTLTLDRDGSITRITPRKGRTVTGSPVDVVHGVSSPREIESQLFASCTTLSEQS